MKANGLKKNKCFKLNFFINFFVFVLLLSFTANAAEVSHPAEQIKAGTFGAGNYVITNNNEVSLTLSNTESGGRQWALVSAGSVGGIGKGKFSVYDKTADVSRLTIDAKGNVGIGTTSPGGMLDIKSPTLGTTALRIYNGFLNEEGLKINAGGRVLQQLSNGNVKNVLNAGGNSYITGGNVGIGTTNPIGKLNVVAGFHDGLIVAGDSGAAAFNDMTYLGNDGANIETYGSNGLDGNGLSNRQRIVLDANTDIQFRTDSIPGPQMVRMMINTTTGNVGIGTTAPGQKLDVAGAAVMDYLILDPQDGVYEGGEIGLRGAGGFGNLQIDNYQGNARIHTLAPGKQFQVLGGAISANSICFGADDCRNSWPAAVTTPNLQQVTEAGDTTTRGINIRGHLVQTGNDPYFRTNANNKHIVLSGGSGWAGTGAVIVLRGADAVDNPHGMTFYTGDAERIRILSNGNVGIGTTDPNPANKLDVAGKIHATGDICTDVGNKCLSTIPNLQQVTEAGDTTTRGINIRGHLVQTGNDPYFRTNANNKHIVLSGGSGWAGTGAVIVLRGADAVDNPHGMTFYTGDAERIRILSNGNVGIGIGTTDPTQKLEVNGAIKGSALIVDAADVGGTLNGGTVRGRGSLCIADDCRTTWPSSPPPPPAPTVSGPWRVSDTSTGWQQIDMGSHSVCFLTKVYGTLEDGAGCIIFPPGEVLPGWTLRADTHVSGRVDCAARCLDF